MNTHEFVKLRNPSSGEEIIVSEHTDELFFKGFTKLVCYVPNSQVDYPEIYASEQDAADERLLNSATDPMIRITEERISGESMYHQPVEIW